MRKGRHDRAVTRAKPAFFFRHQVEFAHFRAQAIVGHGFERVERLEIVWRRDAIKKIDCRKPRRNDPVGWRPIQFGMRPDARPAVFSFRCFLHAQPPRIASRYWRTATRSLTLPASMRSSARRPPKGGAAFGRLTHPS